MTHGTSPEPRKSHPGLEGQLERRERLEEVGRLYAQELSAMESIDSIPDIELSVRVNIAIQNGWVPDASESYLSNAILGEALDRYVSSIPDIAEQAPYADIDELLVTFYSKINDLTIQVAYELKHSGHDLSRFELYKGAHIDLGIIFDAYEQGIIDIRGFCEGIDGLIPHRNIVATIKDRQFKIDLGLI